MIWKSRNGCRKRIQHLRHEADAADAAVHDARAAPELVAHLLRLGDLVAGRVVLDDRAVALDERARGLHEVADRGRIEVRVEALAASSRCSRSRRSR